MDDYRENSSSGAPSGLKRADFKPRGAEETVTYRKWRRTVVAIYAAVLLVGGIGFMVSSPVSNQKMAEISRR
jgi:hypothetical protein